MKEEKDINEYVYYDSNGYINDKGLSNWLDILTEKKRNLLVSERNRKIDSILS